TRAAVERAVPAPPRRPPVADRAGHRILVTQPFHQRLPRRARYCAVERACPGAAPRPRPGCMIHGTQEPLAASGGIASDVLDVVPSRRCALSETVGAEPGGGNAPK